jgi:hypothetical protein
MKYIILEGRLNSLLKELIETKGLRETIEVTGLDIFEIFSRLEKVKIDYELAYDMLNNLFSNHSHTLTKKIGNYKIVYTSFGGTLEWVYEDTNTEYGTEEFMRALCTPFWNGEPYIPIDVDYYENFGVIVEDCNSDVIPIKVKLNSLEELINWYEKVYIKTVFNKLNSFLIQNREKTSG